MIFSWCYNGLGHRIQEKENEKTVFWYDWELSCFVITDDNSSYSLNKIILDFSPVFLDLKKPGSHNLDPVHIPGSLKTHTKNQNFDFI